VNSLREGTPLSPRSIDLNADLGEGFPHDQALLELVTSASICCGAHAGSPEIIRETLIAASARNVVIGAHPGYRDRDGFGRRNHAMTCDEVRDLIAEQLAMINRLAAEVGSAVRFLKPHGALYNQAQHEPEIARGVVAAAADVFRGPLIGQPGTMLERLAAARSVSFIPEGFPDRRYRPDGALMPRSQPDAILREPAEMEAQVLRLVNDGRVATLCIHGDDPRAVENAELVHRVLRRQGILVRSFLDAGT
jgi:5-oxoprolinase (ATP-hydrolysing) subunit A